MARGKRVKQEPEWVLRIGPRGREMVEGRRLVEKGGIEVDGVLYPDELLRPIGGDTYELAPLCAMPEDGSVKHPGDWSAVVPVEQQEYCASWASFDRGRRRLNTDALYQRSDGTGSMLRNVALVVTVICTLYTGIATMSLRGDMGQLQAQLPVISGQIAKLSNPANSTLPTAPNPRDGSLIPDPKVTPTVGLPTGDRKVP
jgi:hypothetical protein